LDARRSDWRGWPVFEVGPADASPVLFLHGGVYAYEIDPFHWRLIDDLVRRTGLRFVVPIMTLAPLATADVTVPAVADLAEELGAERLFGDSSGGGMALAVATLLRDRGRPPLHATVLSAPWLDISGTAPRLAELDASDPWLAVPGTQAAGALYRGDLAVDDPLVSPLFGSLDGLGPVTLFCGTRDILLADAERLIPLANAAGLPLDAHIGKGMIHNFPLLPIPEGRAARILIAEALR
jgi:acetyl esterase/lipase